MSRNIKIIIAGETNTNDNMPLWILCEIPLISCPHYNFISHSSLKNMFVWQHYLVCEWVFYFNKFFCSHHNHPDDSLRSHALSETKICWEFSTLYIHNCRVCWWSHHVKSHVKCSFWHLLWKFYLHGGKFIHNFYHFIKS